jgi:protease I
MSELTDFRVAVLATDGFEESELTEPVRALREAGARVTILSPRPGEIQGMSHDIDKTIKLKVDCTIQSASAVEFDAVHLPGGTLNADAMRMVPEVQAFLRAMQEAGKPISAICHAPWELISAGLVRGRRLTGYHTIQDDVRNAGGQWMDREVVEDGNWVTSRQPTDLPAFNRAMIRLFSRSLAAAHPAHSLMVFAGVLEDRTSQARRREHPRHEQVAQVMDKAGEGGVYCQNKID